MGEPRGSEPLILFPARQRLAGSDGGALLPPTRSARLIAGGEPKSKPVVLIDSNGMASYTTLRKQELVTEMALRHRDIRALDPAVALPYPAAIFLRKGAIVLNLEGLKIIIGREKMLVISVPAPGDLSLRSAPDLASPVVVRLAAYVATRAWPYAADQPDGGGGPAGGGPYSSTEALEEMRHAAGLPFELRALEGALLCVVGVLGAEVAALEATTNPVLARLRRGLVRGDLERLYEVQNRLAKGQARLARMKEVLEEYLDDEELIAGIWLSRPPPAEREDGGGSMLGRSPPGRGSAAEARLAVGSPPGPGGGSVAGGGEEEADEEEEVAGECEDMLEAYWLQVDSLLSRVGILSERLTATEHLVNLDLDAKRNALVALGLALDLLLMGIEVHMMITGTFGINLVNGLERWEPYSVWAIGAVGLAVGSALVVTVGVYAARRGLFLQPGFGRLGGAG